MNRRLTAIMLALIMLFSMFGGAIAEEGESVSALIENALETVQPSAEETDSEVQRVMDKISAIGTVTAQSASAIRKPSAQRSSRSPNRQARWRRTFRRSR